MQKKEEYYTIAEVAEMTGTHPTAVLMSSVGVKSPMKIRARVGQGWLLSRERVETYVDYHRAKKRLANKRKGL